MVLLASILGIGLVGIICYIEGNKEKMREGESIKDSPFYNIKEVKSLLESKTGCTDLDSYKNWVEQLDVLEYRDYLEFLILAKLTGNEWRPQVELTKTLDRKVKEITSKGGEVILNYEIEGKGLKVQLISKVEDLESIELVKGGRMWVDLGYVECKDKEQSVFKLR